MTKRGVYIFFCEEEREKKMNNDITETLLQHVRMKTTSFMTTRSTWLEQCGAVQTPSHAGHVRFNVFVPVPVGKECPWKSSGSQVLNDASMASKQHDLVYLLQYMFLATELTGNGTPNFVISQSTNPVLFKRLLEAYCRVHMHCKKRATQDDQKLLNQYTQNLTTFNPLMHQMLLATKRRLDTPRRGGGAGDEEDDEEDAPAGAGAGAGGGNAPAGAGASADAVNAWISEYLTGFDIVYGGEPDDLPRRMWPLQPLEGGAGNTPYGEDVPAAYGGGGDDDEGDTTSLTLPKVQVTWYIPDPKQQHSIFCFSVLDPMWTFGFVYRFLLNNPPPAQGKTGAWYRQHDPLAHLRHFGSTHVANCFSENLYEEMLTVLLKNRYAPAAPAASALGAGAQNPRGSQRGSAAANAAANAAAVSAEIFRGSYLDDMQNPMFMARVLTLELATETLKKDGLCDEGCLKVLKDNFGNAYGAMKTIRYPDKTRVLSYSLHPKMCFWYHPKYIGIAFTVWPNFKSKRNFAELVGAGRIDITPQGVSRGATPRGLFGDREDAHATAPATADAEGELVETQAMPVLPAVLPQIPARPLIDKGRLCAERPRFLPYETGDQMVLWQAETENAMNKISQLLPKDPVKEPAKYAHYCKVMQEMRESGLEKFCSIYTTDVGLIKNKPICDARKAIITFLSSFTNVTCKLPYLDEDMSCYGNDCIRRMEILGQARKIINCRISFMAGALNSTFDLVRPGKVKFHMQLCGPAQAGKTYPLLQHVREAFIEGTWKNINSSSGKANFIDGHIGSVIALCDEPQQFLTNPKAEEKYYDEVQAAKAVLTDHKHSRTILKQIDVDGVSMRVQHCIETDDPRTWAYCTNQPRIKGSALASRIFQVTVPKPVLLPEDFNFEANPIFQADAKAYLRLDQALCVQIYDAIICGVIPDIDMWLPDNVTARVFSILRRWNIIDSSKGERVRQIIFAFVRHQIIVRGVTACRHVPGGALYNVEYDAKDVYKVGPYLVCTLEIVYAALHLIIGEIIEEDVANVLRAACKECNYDPALSPYENYRRQPKPDTINFKLELNKNAAAAQEEGRYSKDKFNINLNMLAIPGKLKQIASKIERYTQPALDTAQVLSVLESICGKFFPPINGKRYQIETQARMESMVYRGEPFVHPDNPEEPVQIGEESLLVDCEKLMVAEYFEDRKGHFCFCPALIPLLDVEVMDRAFNLATVSASFPRQKAIRGLVHDDNPDIFRVAMWNDDFVNQYVQQIDALHPEAPVLRRDGIALNSKEKLSGMEQDILLSVTLDPRRTNHDDVYWEDVIQSRSQNYRVVTDWELEAAKRVSYRCGEKLQGIVFYTEQEIRKRYVAYCAEHPEAAPVNSEQQEMCYPVSILQEREARDRINQEITNQMTNPKEIRVSSELLPAQIMAQRGFSKMQNRHGREGLRQSSRRRRTESAVPVAVTSSVPRGNPAAAAPTVAPTVAPTAVGATRSGASTLQRFLRNSAAAQGGGGNNNGGV